MIDKPDGGYPELCAAFVQGITGFGTEERLLVSEYPLGWSGLVTGDLHNSFDRNGK